MELAAAGCSPASYGHQVMCLWRILCKTISMHLGKGHYPYAVSYTFLMLFPSVRSVLWSDSARPVSWMVTSSIALLSFAFLDPRAICCTAVPGCTVVDVPVAAPEEQLCWLSHSQDCASRSGHAGGIFLQGRACLLLGQVDF